jgi:hypothetical protein
MHSTPGCAAAVLYFLSWNTTNRLDLFGAKLNVSSFNVQCHQEFIATMHICIPEPTPHQKLRTAPKHSDSDPAKKVQ